MRSSDLLAEFVGKALAQGQARDDIARALAEAGWRPEEIQTALRAWADVAFAPPVPRPRPQVTATEAFIYAGTFISLALSAWHMVFLGFELIDLWLPDPADYDFFDPESVRWSIATLIVSVPAFLLINARAVRAERADAGRRRSAVGRWFGYVTLFLALLGLAGDLVTAIFTVLNGDLTLRFALKAGLVALVAGTIYAYFRARLKGGQDDAAT